MKKNKLLFLVTILVYLFLIGPLVVIMAASFSDTNYLKFPGEGFISCRYRGYPPQPSQ